MWEPPERTSVVVRKRWGGGLGGKEEGETVRNGSMHTWEGKSAGPAGGLITGAGGGERESCPECLLDLCLAWI